MSDFEQMSNNRLKIWNKINKVLLFCVHEGKNAVIFNSFIISFYPLKNLFLLFVTNSFYELSIFYQQTASVTYIKSSTAIIYLFTLIYWTICELFCAWKKYVKLVIFFVYSFAMNRCIFIIQLASMNRAKCMWQWNLNY